jgi:hypothetical protein
LDGSGFGVIWGSIPAFGAVSLHLPGETKKHHGKPRYRPSPLLALNLEPSEYGAGTSISISTALQSERSTYTQIQRTDRPARS